jgi:hypothetical protein
VFQFLSELSIARVAFTATDKKKVHKEAGLYESIFFPALTAVKKYIPTLNLFILSKRHASPSLPCSNTEDDFPVDNFLLIFKVPCTRHFTLLLFGYYNSLKTIKLYYRCTQKIYSTEYLCFGTAYKRLGWVHTCNVTAYRNTVS